MEDVFEDRIADTVYHSRDRISSKAEVMAGDEKQKVEDTSTVEKRR